MNRKFTLLAGAALLASLAGCQHYYRVEDPGTNKIYFTDKVDQKDSGSVVFRDLQTGNEMTLTNSAVKEVPASELPPGVVH